MKIKKPSQRKKILINKPFQLQMSLLLTLWIATLAIIYPLIVYTVFNSLASSVKDLQIEEVALMILEQNQIIFTKTILIYFAFSFLTFLLSLYVSHKIAGPLFKLNSSMNDFSKTQKFKKIYFRKTDFFKELASSYNELMESIHQKDQTIQEKLEKIYPDLNSENKKIIDSILKNSK